MADLPFYRIGEPVVIPFTLASAANPFTMTGLIPQNSDGTILDDLTFMFVNPTPYDVRLEGTPAGATFVPVTSSTGWLIAGRTSSMGPFTSKKPMFCSVQAVSTTGNPIPAGADFTGCALELLYGRGS